MGSPMDFMNDPFRHNGRLYYRLEDFHGHVQEVTNEIAKLKEEMVKNDYQLEDAVAKISKIVAVTPRPLAFVRQGNNLPLEATLLFKLLLPQSVNSPEASPALALVAAYHLLLLWRCMQQLSLLVWFRGRYVIELLPENPSFTSELVNGAVTEIPDMAEYALSVFDAYEKFAQWQTPQLYEERQECFRLIVQGRNHLASTWQSIIDEDADKYIQAVDSALAITQNFDISAGAELSSFIHRVDGIPPEINHLINAEPVPENLPPDYLKLAAKLHYLVVDRLYRAVKSEATDDGEEMNSKLWSYLHARSDLFAAYNYAASSASVGVLSDMRDSPLWQVGSPSTLAPRDQVSPNTDAQRDIFDPTTSIYSGPYSIDSIESGLGTRTRAVSKGSSSSGGRQKERNRYAGGRSDIGDWGGPRGLE
ncbi:hypothetical protein SeMB42_g06870 [Synchytrium endobioticum]|uniref:Uncharacterized protein n=1 Tax=Synchytrium endobioticum TaxID=286115 RepID=A0A507CF69_9FUNG|nr:hypothetical protein SeMB42_g06870 [Synchytrium endobioticum]TPX46950.1 hypothetical protein SeLEV6574_g02923 [Synchytrium endobioticum]